MRKGMHSSLCSLSLCLSRSVFVFGSQALNAFYYANKDCNVCDKFNFIIAIASCNLTAERAQISLKAN